MEKIDYSRYDIIHISPNEILRILPFERLIDKTREFVVVDCGVPYHSTSFNVSSEPLRNPLALVIDSNELLPNYIATVLNSTVGKTFLFGKVTAQQKMYVKKDKIAGVGFKKIPCEMQSVLGKCGQVIQFIDKATVDQEKARLFDLIKNRFTILQNLLIAEMYQQNQQAFRGLDLFSLWEPYANSINEITEETLTRVYSEMYSPNSLLRSKVEIVSALLIQ